MATFNHIIILKKGKRDSSFPNRRLPYLSCITHKILDGTVKDVNDI